MEVEMNICINATEDMKSMMSAVSKWLKEVADELEYFKSNGYYSNADRFVIPDELTTLLNVAERVYELTEFD